MIDCEKCKNARGWFIVGKDGYEYWQECECMNTIRYISMLKNLGLGEEIFKFSFETYQIEEEWQKHIFEKAKKFIDGGKMFYIGGQVGSGKTHICTAIINELLKSGKNCSYRIWADIVTKLKQTTYEDIKKYEQYLDELKTIPVLFIDDFFKNSPTEADKDKAFQFINNRYLGNNITIISSEKSFNELLQIDEAISSRIYQKANNGEFVLSIDKDIKKNYRLKKN